MSGDVQPRKRKDKKRKKEEGEPVFSTNPPVVSFTKETNEDVNIHVHKEEGIGGGIFTKIIFFILFSALTVLIALIIIEHRGLTDSDIAQSHSAYSEIFEGWIQDEKYEHHTLDDHDNQPIVDDLEDDHLTDDEETEEHDQHDDENAHSDENQSELQSEEKTDENLSQTEESQELDQNDEESQENLDYSKDGADDDDDADTIDSEQDQEDSAELDEGDEKAAQSEEQNETEEDEENYSKDVDETVEKSEELDDGGDVEMSEEQDVAEETAEDSTQASHEEDGSIGDDDEVKDGSEEEKIVEVSRTIPKIVDEDEITKSSELNGSAEEKSAEQRDVSEETDIKDNDERVERKVTEAEPTDSKEEQSATPEEATEENVENNPGDSIDSFSVIIRTIIGAAILAVGHFVLVKKWKSDDEHDKNEDVQIDLTRRNTFIPPPPLEEIEQDVEYSDEEYSDEEGEPGCNEEINIVHNITRNTYEQLQSSYSRSVSPESDTSDVERHAEVEMKNSDEEEEIDQTEDEEEEEEVEEEEEEELEEEEDEEEEEYDDDNEDEELLKKLEAKYGKLQRETEAEVSPSKDKSDKNEYEFSNVTNEDDWPIRKELDEAQKNLPHNAANALKMFEKILEKYPSSPRGFFGLAQAYDALAEMKKSNDLLDKAISSYFKTAELKNLPDALFVVALERCINRIQFRGEYTRAIVAHMKLIKKFPHEPKYRNQLAVTYLTTGRTEQARLLLKETIQKWPDDGCALVHYGFIWKTVYNNLEKGVHFMQKGVDTKAPCVLHGRFYFHLGDAYFRLGYKDKAVKLYEEGVKHKLFLSKYQRSLYNVPRLTARPWWNKSHLTSYQKLFADLETYWQIIRNEGEAVLNEKGYFQDESENLKNTGDWKQFELFSRARKNVKNCNKTPFTCKLLERHPEAISCRRGQTKFSVMHPGTHVWAHCGPTNCRLRVHLGLRVPLQTFIRVADGIRNWQEGKVLIFDDSFEHEVWHNGSEIRLVLIVDVWHPELSNIEKETLSSI